MTSTVLKRIIAVLNLPSKISELIIRAKTVLKAMRTSSYFTNLSTELDVLEASITTLETAEVGCNTTPPSVTTEDRNYAADLVRNHLRSLKNSVQVIADADLTNAQAIILSAAMDIKAESARTNKYNVAENTAEEGTVILYGQSAGGHDWRMSTDDATWTTLDYSNVKTKVVNNLSPGVIYYFQNRRVLNNNERGEWSNSIKIRVM